MVNTPPAPTLTPRGDANPSPRVVVTFSSIDPTADTITVYRLADGETTTVTGSRRAPVAGAFAVVDYEAPTTSCQYWAQAFAGDTPSALGPKTTVTLASDTPVDMWLSDPLDPSNATPLILQKGALQGIAPRMDLQKLDLPGRAKPPVQFFGRGALENLPLPVICPTAEDATRLWRALAAQPLLLRPASHPLFALLPKSLYCTLAGPAAWPGWRDTDGYGALAFNLVADEVARQSLDVFNRVVSIGTYMDAYPTYDAAMQAAATYDAQIANPPGGL